MQIHYTLNNKGTKPDLLIKSDSIKKLKNHMIKYIVK